VHVLSYGSPPRLGAAPGLVFHEVTVRDYPLFEYPPYSLALAGRMVTVAREQGLDLLHVHYAVPNAISAVLARQIVAPRSLPVVTTLHGTDVTLVGSDESYRVTTRWGIEQSDAVTAVSQWLCEEARQRFDLSRRIEVIPNFVDGRRFTRQTPRARRWGTNGDPLLVHVSNFRPVKRLVDVVAIFERICAEVPAARLLLVGEGPDRGGVEERCRRSAAAERIAFAGPVVEVEDVLAEADLLLLPSETESFGLAALEALASEVPVVASRTGGLPEVVEDGVHGLLFPVGDIEAMASGAAALLRDETRRRAMGRAARSRALERFGRDETVALYRALFARTIDGVG
jgi:N-acetyl-alpha-D-glucosaminyl L-malate synthase BshA